MTYTSGSVKMSFKLREDVVMRPVASLRESIRAQIACSVDDIAITAPDGRLRSLVVDPEAAAFLAEFREASTLPAALARHRLRTMAIEHEDREFAALVERASATGLLERVVPSAASAIDWAEVGEIHGMTVVGLVQAMEDTAILRVCQASGEHLALKIAQIADHGLSERALEHERRVLERLAQPVAAELRANGRFRGRPYLATRWFEARDILTVGNAERAKVSSWKARLKAFRPLVLAMLDRYRELHELGIAHGDIHPKNILIGHLGEVRLIDFALANVYSSLPPFGPGQRNGVPYFFEPAYAAAYLEGRELPPASFETDLHGLAALTYLLLTGSHYAKFRLERDQFLRQIVCEPARSFADQGLDDLPEVERVLARALGRGEAPPFLSVAAFREALAEASWAPQVLPPRTSRPLLPRLARTGADFRWPLRAPRASAHFGAAGIAWAFLREAELRNDASRLADAAVWSARAVHGQGSGSFVSAERGIDEAAAHEGALHFGALGVDLVDALVALARWDPATLDLALGRFCARKPGPRRDLMSGRAGQLLGCALLAEAIPPDPLVPMREQVLTKGRESVCALDQDWPDIESRAGGVAHGAAGIAYALLRWSSVTLDSPNSALIDLLDAHSVEKICSATDNRFPASWCNGSAGLVHLFCEAFAWFEDERFLHSAIAAADHCFAAPSAGPSLCCGDAGIAYAQLALWRKLNDGRYLERARMLAARARQAVQFDDTSLFKDRVGVDLLCMELGEPLSARMPLFEASGWPRWSLSGSERERPHDP